MQTNDKKQTNAACQACNAEKIHNELKQILGNLFHSCDSTSISIQLFDWLYLAVGSPDMNYFSEKERANIVYLYKQISDTVTKLDNINKQLENV